VKVEIKVPAVGESISEATIGEWTKKSGEFVKRDEIILLLETDKASVEVVAPNDGVLSTVVKAGDVVKIGAVVASIDTEGVATAGMPQPAKSMEQKAAAPAPASGGGSGSVQAPTAGPAAGKSVHPDLQGHMSPAVTRVVNERGLDPAQISGTGKDGRITKQDAVGARAPGVSSAASATPASAGASPVVALPVKNVGSRGERRVAMTTIRKRTAEKLVQSQATTATLTTFNEIDMTAVTAIREKYKDKFKEKYGISLGFMGFFVKATVEALKALPQVNAFIDGTELVYHDYVNIGVAVSTEKGLLVPVVKNADQMSVAEIEMAIRHYALKARDNKISIDDLSGGTFTISNGGVFGSLMSTPILNPPQSGILGMHKVEDRPVVVGGQIVIRPMMYVALSYDHRVIDGKESVSFLVKIKEGVEDPSRLLLEI
jgi:2-oxoglutarate dehydrogenase E2 component (dihydrolipoamide succinyltransferase)